MDSSIEYMLQKAERAKACDKTKDIKTAEELHELIFSPEGREFLKARPNLYGILDAHRLREFMNRAQIGFYRYALPHQGATSAPINSPQVFAYNGSIALHYTDPSQLYKAIVWDVEQLRIHIEAYCMLQLTIIGEMPVIDIIHQGEEAEIFYE